MEANNLPTQSSSSPGRRLELELATTTLKAEEIRRATSFLKVRQHSGAVPPLCVEAMTRWIVQSCQAFFDCADKMSVPTLGRTLRLASHAGSFGRKFGDLRKYRPQIHARFVCAKSGHDSGYGLGASLLWVCPRCFFNWRREAHVLVWDGAVRRNVEGAVAVERRHTASSQCWSLAFVSCSYRRRLRQDKGRHLVAHRSPASAW